MSVVNCSRDRIQILRPTYIINSIVECVVLYKTMQFVLYNQGHSATRHTMTDYRLIRRIFIEQSSIKIILDITDIIFSK